MPAFPLLFVSGDPGLLLYGQYDPWLVVLSVGVAMFASAMGLHAASLAADRSAPGLRRLMLLAGSASLGCGVWAMHFVGMLAFQLCIPVSYSAGLTMLSFLPSLAASWVALNLLAQDRVSGAQLLTSGVLVGAGIGAMHYTGMAAMRMSAVLQYDPWGFGLSIVVAVALAVLALWVRFGLSTWRMSRVMHNALAGIVMGSAIAGMHYTGMAAARFIGAADRSGALHMTDPVPLALSVTLITVIATGFVAAATGLLRYRELLLSLQGRSTQLRAVFETSTDAMVIMDSRGTVLDFNASAERICQIRREDVVGKPIGLIMVEPFRSQALADFAGYIQRLKMGMEYETEVPRPDGQPNVPARLVVGKAGNGDQTLYVAAFADISERAEMEKALRHSERQFRSLISNIPGVSFRARAEPGWPIVFVSDAVERITGYEPAAFVGKTPQHRIAEMIDPADLPKVAQSMNEAIAADEPYTVEFRLRDRHGNERWIWAHGRCVDDNEGDHRWIDGVLLDITERRQMEEDLRDAKLRAEDAAQARTAFLANMSHEIRTPMNAIIGFTEVVLGGSLEAEARQHLQTVRNSARSLLVLLNDILDTSKLERGAVELESLPFELPVLLRQVLSEQSLQARKKNLALQLDLDPTLPAVLLGDAHRIKQVLVNLVGNAVKFTERGGVTLRARRDGQRLMLSVRDTGIGIAPDRLQRIFDPFTQADASMSRRYGGTGLGTTISRQLTELMGGSIRVESSPGQGSVFIVELPLQAASADVAPATTHHGRITLPALHVLVVDDVPENRSLLNVVLGREGHTVVEADNGLTALQCFGREHFDVVLMDLQMPELDGLSACQRIRDIERATGQARTPVIALSASVFQDDRHAAFDAGMDGFAFKPVDREVLLEEIARVLGLLDDEHVDAALPDSSAQPIDEAPVSVAGLPLIDAEQGLQRWGDARAWAQSLSQFAQAKKIWLSEQQPDRPPEADPAANAGHRLKGVAANLGLPALQAAGDQLERQARSEAAPAWHPAWVTLLRVLSETLQAANQQVDSNLADSRPADSRAQAPHTVADRALLHSALERLTAACARGERLDDVINELPQLAAGLVPEADITRLLQSIDDFDFDAAQLTLSAWRAQLSATEAQDVRP